MSESPRWTAIGLSICLAVVLPACGSDDGDSGQTAEKPAESSVPAGGPGEYEFEYEGATGVIAVPSDSSDPAVAGYEAYRKKAGAPPVTYFVAKVNNSEGTENITVNSLVVVTGQGQQIEARGPDEEIITKWQGDPEKNPDLYNEGVDLSNEATYVLRPGAEGTIVLACEEDVPSVRRVYVAPIGGPADTEMTKVR